jgi:hypothetical protein
MQLSLAAIVAAAFTSLASAYTQPVGAQPSGNPTSHPALAEQVPVGVPFDITWTPTTPGTVTILLLNGPSTNIQVLYPIVEKISNSGSYSWTPKTNLAADVTHYGIQIIDDATGAYQYSPQFGIKNTASASGSAAGSTSAPPTSSGSGSGSGSAAPATHTAASRAPPTTAPASTTAAAGTLSTVRASTAAVATAWSNSTTGSATGSAAVSSTPTAPSSSRAGRVAANAAAALAAVGALALLVL